MRHLLTTLLLLIFTNFLFSQNNTLSGVILDSQDQPVEFANVLLLKYLDSTLVKGVLTDVNGVYKFENIDNGNYLINSSMIGYGKVYSLPIELKNANNIQMPQLLLVDGVDIEEIAIVGKKAFIEMKADKMIINVANSSVNTGNSALEVLKKSPGVSTDNNDELMLRGKSGILVTINGKEQYLSGEDLTRFLENMPASNIQAIEIITNPSAKYEAEGNSGVINIILKKNENLGMNGNFTNTLRQGRKTSHFHKLGLNYRKSKINLYSSVEFNKYRNFKLMGLKRVIPYQEGTTTFEQLADENEVGHEVNLQLGADWDITSKTSLSTRLRRSTETEDEVIRNVNNIEGANKPVFDQLIVNNDNSEDYVVTNFNVNLNHKFNDRGLQLNFDTDYNIHSSINDINYENLYNNKEGDAVLNPFYLRNNQQRNIRILASKVDLEIPISEKWNLEVGSKYSMVGTQNMTLFEYQNDEDQWINQEDRTNDFIYDENVFALYANTNGSIGEFSIQAGLRMENTNTLGESITLQKITPRKYVDFFPSISVARTFAEKHSVSLAYSRRLQRPNYNDLNPFEYFLDEFTFNRGNPLLNPQYATNLGLNYGLGNQLFVSLDYSRVTDAITEVIEQNSAESKTFQTNQNLDNYTTVALTLSKPKVWSESITSRFNYTALYIEFNSAIPSGTLETRKLTHMVNISNEIQLPNDWSMEVNGEIQSALHYGYFQIEPKGSLDFGFSKSFLAKRLKLGVSVSDLFYTDQTNVQISQDDIDLKVTQFRDSRRVSVNLSYNFGNQKVKGAKSRQTAAQEETNRI